MAWTIYLHRCTVSGKGYVGQTEQKPGVRWSAHKSDKSGCRHLRDAIRKHGADAFDHKVLEVCATQESANAAERSWIAKLGTLAPNGYNLTPGGEGNEWARMPNESRELHASKIRAAAAMRSPEQRAERARKISAGWSRISADEKSRIARDRDATRWDRKVRAIDGISPFEEAVLAKLRTAGETAIGGLLFENYTSRHLYETLSKLKGLGLVDWVDGNGWGRKPGGGRRFRITTVGTIVSATLACTSVFDVVEADRARFGRLVSEIRASASGDVGYGC